MDLSSVNDNRVINTVYLNLSEINEWLEVEKHHCDKCGLKFLVGKKTRENTSCIVIPLSCCLKLSPTFSFYKELTKCLPDNSGVYLALVDLHSNVALYEMDFEFSEPVESDTESSDSSEKSATVPLDNDDEVILIE